MFKKTDVFEHIGRIMVKINNEEQLGYLDFHYIDRILYRILWNFLGIKKNLRVSLLTFNRNFLSFFSQKIE